MANLLNESCRQSINYSLDMQATPPGTVVNQSESVRKRLLHLHTLSNQLNVRREIMINMLQSNLTNTAEHRFVEQLNLIAKNCLTNVNHTVTTLTNITIPNAVRLNIENPEQLAVMPQCGLAKAILAYSQELYNSIFIQNLMDWEVDGNNDDDYRENNGEEDNNDEEDDDDENVEEEEDSEDEEEEANAQEIDHLLNLNIDEYDMNAPDLDIDNHNARLNSFTALTLTYMHLIIHCRLINQRTRTPEVCRSIAFRRLCNYRIGDIGHAFTDGFIRQEYHLYSMLDNYSVFLRRSNTERIGFLNISPFEGIHHFEANDIIKSKLFDIKFTTYCIQSHIDVNVDGNGPVRVSLG